MRWSYLHRQAASNVGSIKRVHSKLGHIAVPVKGYQQAFWVSNDATPLCRMMTSSVLRGKLAMASEHHHAGQECAGYNVSLV